MHTVGDIRKKLAKLPDDFPVDWYVDVSDYESREAQRMQILVDTSIIERTDEEMEDAPKWTKRRMLLFMIG